MQMFVPALPATARDLHASAGTIQLTVSMYVLGLAVGQSFYGPLSDRLGRRPLLLGGLVLYVVASIAAALAQDAGQLIAVRVAQAFGACAGLVLGRAMVRDITASEARAAGAMATLTTALALFPALAPMLGAWLTAWVGWRYTFGALAFAGAALLALSAFTLPETLRERNPDAGPAAVFRSYRKLIRMPVFMAYAIGASTSSTTLYAFFSSSPFILLDLLHRPQHEVGVYYLLVSAAIAAGSFSATRLVRRTNPRVATRFGSALQIAGAGLLLAAEATDSLNVVTLILPVLIFSVGAGLAAPVAGALAIGAAPGLSGAASALYGTLQMVMGAAASAAVSLAPSGSVLPTALVLAFGALVSTGVFAWGRRASPR